MRPEEKGRMRVTLVDCLLCHSTTPWMRHSYAFGGQYDAPDSTELRGSALRHSQYAWHFNTLPPPCFIHTHHRQRGDETWRRPPKRHAKTEPSPSISRIHPPTSS